LHRSPGEELHKAVGAQFSGNATTHLPAQGFRVSDYTVKLLQYMRKGGASVLYH